MSFSFITPLSSRLDDPLMGGSGFFVCVCLSLSLVLVIVLVLFLV
jgi:heme exporter protein D